MPKNKWLSFDCNPEYRRLYCNRSNVFNSIADRLEALVPDPDCGELISSLHDLEDACEELAKYEKLHEINFLFRQLLIEKMPGIDVDAIYPNYPEPATIV